MKTTAIVAALAATVIAADSNNLQGRNIGCGGDNCFNQVSATRFGSATLLSHLADCSAYLESTYTPNVSTVTTTIATSTSTLTLRYDTIPPYASGCSSSDFRYRSACSCAGVVATTVTAATPIVTAVVQVVATEYFPPYASS